ncbi:hypothetical protein C440_05557 [Haloferax mucosum ATCC BAA-1512]|uniref:Uncharacterized protein n=1 Tax=Haloferax mucosum ATCC BAA-1512 TaxID=662479 RepID=M0IH14_9EURY|nr:hypothetical protein [Haloferax mucosum]ELZ96031.1 hypothetical protein C440_05557 [Haloferax mucosum ATCC BAA-1512]
MAVDSGSLVLPLIVLVIVELSGVARDVDLKKAVLSDYPPILFSFLDGGMEIIPRFGRFNFIHGMNTTLILFGVLLLSGDTLGLALLSSMILFVVWVALPLLEVKEYDDILATGTSPTSIHWHLGSGVIAIPYTVVYERYLENSEFARPLLVFVFIFAAGVLLINLETELEAAYSDT